QRTGARDLRCDHLQPAVPYRARLDAVARPERDRSGGTGVEAGRALLHGGKPRPALRANAQGALRVVRDARRQQQVPGQPRTALIRNSLLPSAPAIGLSMVPSTFQSGCSPSHLEIVSTTSW